MIDSCGTVHSHSTFQLAQSPYNLISQLERKQMKRGSRGSQRGVYQVNVGVHEERADESEVVEDFLESDGVRHGEQVLEVAHCVLLKPLHFS